MQILVNHRVSHVTSHVTRIPSSNQDRIQDVIQRWENESETNCIMKFSFLKCSKNRTWRKLLIWTWSRKIKFLHFVKLLFSQQIIENKNFDLSAVLVFFGPDRISYFKARRVIKNFYGWVNESLHFTAISQSSNLGTN